MNHGWELLGDLGSVLAFYSLGRREIPKDLGELKILEEDNLAAVEREATEHQAYMVGYEAAYAANFE